MKEAREHYTAEEEAIIASGWVAGDSIVEIAERLGRTPGSVAAYASKNGYISSWSVGTTVADRIGERALVEGWRPSRIARQYGLKVAVVERLIVRARRIVETGYALPEAA